VPSTMADSPSIQLDSPYLQHLDCSPSVLGPREAKRGDLEAMERSNSSKKARRSSRDAFVPAGTMKIFL
jgi:hypothetical protein